MKRFKNHAVFKVILRIQPVKDSDLLEMTSLKKLPSETRTEALLVKYVAYFGICQ